MTKLFEKVLARTSSDSATRINGCIAENRRAASLRKPSRGAQKRSSILDFSPVGERASHDFRKIAVSFLPKAGVRHVHGFNFPSAAFNFAAV